MPGVAHGLFPRGGADLVFYFYADCNRRLADQLAAEVRAERQAEGEGAEKPVQQLVHYYMSGVMREKTCLRGLRPGQKQT